MTFYRFSKHKRFCAVLAFLFPLSAQNGVAQSSAAVNYGLKLKHYNSSILPRKSLPRFTLHGYYPIPGASFYSDVSLDFQFESLDSLIVVRRTVAEKDVRPPIVLSFLEYQSVLQEQEQEDSWREYVVRNITEDEQGRKGRGGINLDIPVKIRSKTFQKIFGSGTVGLTVTGDIRIQAGLRRENRSEVRTVLGRGATTNFKMQQTQRFSVTGKIGDKVTVNVDQDSERAFDFDNNVKLVYQGYDDEIIRRIDAGNISLSLPGTRYVTFSGKNTGLFGIKTEMALGNLNLTTIASQEKGESQRLSLAGGATEGTKQVKDYQYLANTYFFLDFGFREQYRHFNENGDHLSGVTVPKYGTIFPVKQDSIEVYKAAAGYETQFPDKVIRGWATLNGSPQDTLNGTAPGEAVLNQFIRLERSEYIVVNQLGYIRMNTPVSENEILAVAYVTEDGKRFGDLNFQQDDNKSKTIVLKLIKDRSPRPSHKTWDLAWKHVYSLGSRNIPEEGFDVKIYFDPASGPDEETNTDGRKWVTVFGLDNTDNDGQPNPDGIIDNDETIVDRGNGELHFRDLQPFDPVGYFVGNDSINQVPLDKRTSVIYDTTVQSVITGQSKFFLEVKTKNRSTDYNLGFNVIEGSEVVTLDGEVLQKGRDYTIDYFSGQLTILNERASNPSAQLDISYERNQLFQLEKKTILGMRAEYNLGRDSFIGSTLLYLNESTLDRKVRVGRGPMRNLVWDLNTRLKFKPNFIGNAFDFLPFIRAKGETNLNFEGEIAQVLPTPNTLNSKKTGDNRGVAYIDDFEASKKTINLGIIRKNWTQASQPADGVHDYRNMLNNWIWYNPVTQVPIRDIYPNREVNANVPNRVDVLNLRFFRDTEEPEADPKRWGGVMRALSPGFFDQSQTKFIEIMVWGDHGRLHLDLGTISEDVIPNKSFDTEDEKTLAGRNGILDPGEDVGIDGVPLPDPPTLNFPRTNFAGEPAEQVPYDFWDVNRDGIKDADEPWSYDNWFYPELSIQYITEGTGSINGSENSANDQGGRVPDTEDINGNGIVDLNNQYFSFSVSLDKSSEDASLIEGGNPEKGWFLYRIPFNELSADTVIGHPSVTQIEYARLWFDELDPNEESTFIRIAEINLVGSEWKELGTTTDEYNLSSGLAIRQDNTVAVKQINTFENADYAATLSEIGVEGEEDRITGVRAREQSLVLKGFNLPAGEAGIAQKSLFQGENYIHYDRIKMFVYGNDSLLTHIPFDTSGQSYIEYFVRFGADVNNYYEYRSKVYQGWSPENNTMDVPIQEFTNLIDRDTNNKNPRPYIEKKLTPDGSKVIRRVGNPSFTNIKILLLGIKNLHPDGLPFNGELWFNELRLSDVQQDKGIAMRVRTDLKVADFMSINGEVERKDADFHNVATRFGTGNNQVSGNFNANINVDKFLPQSWGLAMPLNLTYRRSNSEPKYFPGQDRLVTGDLPEEDLAQVRSKTRQTGFNIAFRRRAKSKNFFLKNTLDGMNMSLGRSESNAENPTTNFSRNISWNGNFDYKLNFGRNNYVSLFSWLPNLPLINKARATKFYYTPQNVSFKVSGAKRERVSQTRIQAANDIAPDSTEVFTIDRSVRTSMKVFESLTLDWSRAHKADFRNSDIGDFFSFNFNDINITQSFSARYTPRVFSWLSNNFSYTSNYSFNNNLQKSTLGRSARGNRSINADFNFQWKQLVKSIFGEKRSTPRGRGRGRRGRRGRSGGNNNNNNQKQLLLFQQKGEGDGKSFNPLRIVGSFFSNFKDISFNYSEQRNIFQQGLAADAMPSYKFQFGLSDTTGVASDSTLSTVPTTLSNSQNYSVSSGIAFGRAIDIGLRFQHRNQINQSNQVTGSTSNSWLLLGSYDLPFPEWTVRISGLQKLPFFSKIFQNVTFTHGFSGQKDVTTNGATKTKTSENFTTNFRPLGKLDLNFKNGFTGSIQLNHARSLNKNLASAIGARRTTNSDFSITANYSKRSGFRLPIWPFNKAELKNSIDFSFTFTTSTAVTELATGDQENQTFEEQDKTKRWSVSPRLTYSFSDRVRGGAFLEIGKTDSKRVGQTSVQEFGIDINIAIRGN